MHVLVLLASGFLIVVLSSTINIVLLLITKRAANSLPFLVLSASMFITNIFNLKSKVNNLSNSFFNFCVWLLDH